MKKIEIAVVDYGMGNLHSVAQAIRFVAEGQQVIVTDDPAIVAQAGRVVFPGQGAMPDCIRELDARNLRQAVIDATNNKPFLGICIGLQMLFEQSEEGNAAGLGLVSGQVKKFTKTQDTVGNKLKIPHMGWNTVRQTRPHAMWQNIDDESRFYFVHSYFVAPTQADLTVGKSEYPDAFTSAIARDNVFAVQFHPEKSAKSGLRLLHNFIHWKP